MLEFIISKHAKERMEQRNIISPNSRMFVDVNKRLKTRLKKLCPKEKYNPNCVYFITKNGDCYVCIPEDIAKYTVITAFNMDKSWLELNKEL